MAKEDFTLRETVNAPLTTKGSTLTFAELDANFITAYNALVSLSQSSNIDAYDGAKSYYLNDAVQEGTQLYKCIVTGPITATTPSANPASWIEIYATDLVDAPRKYKKYSATLVQEGTNDPVATVLQNDLAGSISFPYSAVGEYDASSLVLFTSGKTVVDFNINVFDVNDEAVSRRRITDTSNIYLSVVDSANTETNGWSGDITIIVYD
tara:strand:+ start:246 stop:872 length:627 start_codon:yes stop_codon:yes gene_type:complete